MCSLQGQDLWFLLATWAAHTQALVLILRFQGAMASPAVCTLLLTIALCVQLVWNNLRPITQHKVCCPRASLFVVHAALSWSLISDLPSVPEASLCTLYPSHSWEAPDSAINTLSVSFTSCAPCLDLHLSSVSSVLSRIRVWQKTKCISSEPTQNPSSHLCSPLPQFPT